MKILNRLKITQKFLIMGILFLVCLVGVAGVNIMAQQKQLLDERMLKTRHMSEVAFSVIETMYAHEKAGTMTREEAQAEAKETLRAMRYDGKEYFWVHGSDGEAVMHPIFPNFEGGGLESKNKKVFDLFTGMNAALKKANGPIPYEYMWPKASVEDKTILFPKSSYIIPFAPWGWAVGTGIYIDDVYASFMNNVLEASGGILVLIIVLGGVLWLMARNIAKPVEFFASSMKALSEGDTSIRSQYADRSDEVGAMGRAFDVFTRNAIEKQRLETDKREEELRQTEERRTAMRSLADAFDQRVGKIVTTVEEAARGMMDLATNLTAMVSETSKQSETVSISSRQASANVQTVAAAAEELTASILEISKSLSDTATVAKTCSAEADRSRDSLNALQKSVSEVDSVVGAINDIAEQTNLLALNATIEAARAGEAGKGFAVVAAEVKNLANETGKMTEEITRKVESIKQNAHATIDRVIGIIGGIAQVDQQTTSIAGAVEEQNAATREISRNAQEASHGTGDVMRSIQDVQAATTESADATSRVRESSASVVEQTRTLKQAVNDFLKEVRAA